MKQHLSRAIILTLCLALLLPCFSIADTIAGREYTNLPELMIAEDGSEVATIDDFAARRLELLKLFSDTMYNPIPADGFTCEYTLLEQGDTLDGAAVRKQIQITVTADAGSSDALMLLILPKSDMPVPVVFGLSDAVHTVMDDAAILPSYSINKYPTIPEDERGAAADSWCIAEAVARGYGIAVVNYQDFVPDHPRTFSKRLISLFGKETLPILSAWAFGLERMADYLVTDPSVDASRLVITGTSRYGKSALWAGANDERIALVIPNVSGTCGAALSRSNEKEQVVDLNANFRWWMNDEFKTYNERIDELPIDQHELIACIAPRKIYLSSAEIDTSNDAQGTWIALLLSRDAFRLYGLDVIEGEIGEQPAVGERVFTESMGYHLRSGTHGITPEDWNNYFDYMDEYLR